MTVSEVFARKEKDPAGKGGTMAKE